MKKSLSPDAQIIDHLGGPAEVARKLGFRDPGGYQRVHNWRTRGIPARVKLAHPKLFMRKAKP